MPHVGRHVATRIGVASADLYLGRCRRVTPRRSTPSGSADGKSRTNGPSGTEGLTPVVTIGERSLRGPSISAHATAVSGGLKMGTTEVARSRRSHPCGPWVKSKSTKRDPEAGLSRGLRIRGCGYRADFERVDPEVLRLRVSRRRCSLTV